VWPFSDSAKVDRQPGVCAPPEPDDPGFDALGGYEIQKYIVAELNEERARRVRIDTQGAALITGSTALSGLAFAATTLVTVSNPFELPRASLWALALTFVAFMVAAYCGLRGGGKVHDNETVPIDEFEAWRSSDEMWLGGRESAGRQHLEHLIVYLRQLRGFNKERAEWIVRGSRWQIAALLGLSLAVAVLLVSMMVPDAAGPLNMLEPPR
jgi:hypothetical protein